MPWEDKVPRGALGWRNLLLWALLAALAVVAYRAAAAVLYRVGFPLDDAWIHQTYARNLASGLGWVYRAPDFGRGGATAPLWVLLLAWGHLLGLSPGLWVSLWGWALLTALAGFAASWPGFEGRWRAAAALAVLGQWHLVWAAVSGMETLAFTLTVFVGLWALVHPRPRWGWAAFALAAGLWLRPEAVLLTPLAGLRAWSSRAWRERSWWGFVVVVGGAVLGYGAFHVVRTGAWGPTTGLAKMHEYAVLRQAPFGVRWVRVWLPVLVGPGAWALAGIFWAVFAALVRIARVLLRASVRREALIHNAKAWGPRPSLWMPLLWLILHSALYAWRLPVTYQHGRYMMPVLPALTVAGVLAWQRVAAAWSGAWQRRGMFALTSLAVLGGVGFLVLGARAYAWDVAFIESEMVDTAHWVAGHLPPDAVVAAHDIGALGYYAPQPLADLAGLLDPEVIPMVRDEAALARYLQARDAAYLVTFPGWYADLDRCSVELFVTRAPYAPALGGENMVVYAWQPCPTR